MIEKLEIKNFQTHKHLLVEFGEGVTSIVGPSDSGKSAIVRAFQWVTTNKPSGEAFIRHGTKKAAARVIVDGDKITRVRGKGKNSYRLNNSDYSAFGNDVPETISKTLNLSPLNFQSQHDAPFWFCETAGEVSRQLNSIVNLEVIDRTLSNISSLIKKQKSTIEVVERRKTRLESLKETFDYLEEMDRELSDLESEKEALDKKTHLVGVLRDLLKKGLGYRDQQDRALKLNQDGQKVVVLGNRWTELKTREQNLAKLVNALAIHSRNAKNRPDSFEPIEVLWNKVDNKRTAAKQLSSIISNAHNSQKEVKRCQKEVKEAMQNLKEEFGTVCPLCEQQIQ